MPRRSAAPLPILAILAMLAIGIGLLVAVALLLASLRAPVDTPGPGGQATAAADDGALTASGPLARQEVPSEGAVGSAPDGATRDAAHAARIVGRAVSAGDGAPVQGARVTLRRNSPFMRARLSVRAPSAPRGIAASVRTGADGRFELQVPASRQRWIVTIDEPRHQRWTSAELTAAAADLDLGSIALQPQPLTTTVVRGAGGEPLPGAMVWLRAAAAPTSTRVRHFWTANLDAPPFVTSEHGEVSLPRSAPAIDVLVMAEGHRPALLRSVAAPPASIQLEAGRWWRVRTTVLGQPPPQPCHVALLMNEPLLQLEASCDGAGRSLPDVWSFGGRVTLQAELRAEGLYSAEQQLPAMPQTLDVDLQRVIAPLHVAWEAPAGAVGDDPVVVGLVRLESTGEKPFTEQCLVARCASGGVVFTPEGLGSYQVLAFTPAAGVARSAVVPHTRVPQEVHLVWRGETAAALDVRVVDVRVVDERGTAIAGVDVEATLELDPAEWPPDLPRRASATPFPLVQELRADASGVVRVRGVTRATTRVVCRAETAAHGSGEVAFAPAASAAPAATAATAATAAPAAPAAPALLVLQRGTTVEVHVRTAGEASALDVRRIRVEVTPDHPGSHGLVAALAGAGRFVVPGVPRGPFRVQASTPTAGLFGLLGIRDVTGLGALGRADCVLAGARGVATGERVVTDLEVTALPIAPQLVLRGGNGARVHGTKLTPYGKTGDVRELTLPLTADAAKLTGLRVGRWVLEVLDAAGATSWWQVVEVGGEPAVCTIHDGRVLLRRPRGAGELRAVPLAGGVPLEWMAAGARVEGGSCEWRLAPGAYAIQQRDGSVWRTVERVTLSP